MTVMLPERAPHAAARGGPAWRCATWVLLALLLVFVVLTFDQHGISNDEEVQHTYGQLLLDFYGSGLRDVRAFEYRNLYLYGGLFDLVAAALAPLVPLDVWDLRHLLTALSGLAGIGLAAALARQAAGDRAGFLAALFLALTGAFGGAMFTHTKDVPFATAMAWATWSIARLSPGWPHPRWRDVVQAGLAIGCALGLRVGGVLALGYLGLTALVAAYLRSPHPSAALRVAVASLPRLIAATGVAGIVMAVAWPWSVMGWTHVPQALGAFSHFSFDLFTQMAGRTYAIADVPRGYLPAYLLVRLPEVVLLGLGLAVAGAGRALATRSVDAERVLAWLPVTLAAVVPVAVALATRPALYNGVRHFTFVLPPLAVLAAGGFEAAFGHLRPVALRAALALLLAALGADALVTQARLHPYGYVAYNRLAGGLPGAFGRWELDYWGDSLRAATAVLNDHVAAAPGSGPPWTVAVCAEDVQAAAWLAPGLQVTRDWPRADFFLASTQGRCDAVLDGRIVGTVSREGIALAVVKDRRPLSGAAAAPGVPSR